jgi:hypothetical protein
MAGLNKLSAVKVNKLSKPGRYGDGGGLWLQVSQVGKGITKSWLFRYMLHGKARQMGLGPLHTVSLADARERARQARTLLLDDIDPIDAGEAGATKRRPRPRSGSPSRMLPRSTSLPTEPAGKTRSTASSGQRPSGRMPIRSSASCRLPRRDRARHQDP